MTARKKALRELNDARAAEGLTEPAEQNSTRSNSQADSQPSIFPPVHQRLEIDIRWIIVLLIVFGGVILATLKQVTDFGAVVSQLEVTLTMHGVTNVPPTHTLVGTNSPFESAPRVIGTTPIPTQDMATANPTPEKVDRPEERPIATLPPNPEEWLTHLYPPLKLGEAWPTAIELSLAQAGISGPIGSYQEANRILAEFCRSREDLTAERDMLHSISDMVIYAITRNSAQGQADRVMQQPVFGCLPGDPSFLLTAQLIEVTNSGEARLHFPEQWQLADTTINGLPHEATTALSQWEQATPNAWGVWLVKSDALVQALWRCRNTLVSRLLVPSLAEDDNPCDEQKTLLAQPTQWDLDALYLVVDVNQPSEIVWQNPVVNDASITWVFGDAFALRQVLRDMPPFAVGEWYGLARAKWDASAGNYIFTHLFARENREMKREWTITGTTQITSYYLIAPQ